MDITSLAQLWIGQFLREGDLSIDATVGNGHDTLFLAGRVGGAGKIIGFDVQRIALAATRSRLESEGLLPRVKLLHRSHAEMAAALAESGETRQARAIMFNLGYLPGSDKSVTTRTDPTLLAVAAALDLLAPGGAMTVVLYPGHPEGEREFTAVSRWAEKLSGTFDATLFRPLNRSGKAPSLIAVEKKRD